ncbi:hypothetical protein Back2_05060 [Nocardioides baekrokdamisoli]|uniref:Uncharacterized protein n=1 Tax=Nocardioides baekrokdamisoli TaxID=1804624 RepID=A0A3G9IZS5_9ACTN|nr:hypothetical protein [Nocardioides baekrokdamisoli]BBH16219.1 hypothetical protein Back2_05060 [Nocardioides baekrokdamisoli]
MMFGMSEITLTGAQADRTLALCAGIRSRPGMWIADFDWVTADAFWSGHLHAIHEEAVGDFRTWGLAHLGTPESNTDPVFQLKRLYGLPADDAREASFTRDRASEISGLIEAWVGARRA